MARIVMTVGSWSRQVRQWHRMETDNLTILNSNIMFVFCLIIKNYNKEDETK